MVNRKNRLTKSGVQKIRKALLRKGLKIEKEAKFLCPVDTGRLRSSIRASLSGDRVVVGTNVYYAPDVEFGTERQSAQPFLRPAIDKVVNR